MKPTYRFFVILIIALSVTVFSLYAGKKEIFASAQDDEEVTMVVLMYHALMKNEKKAGDYIITPTAFENDLKYIRDQGYTTVVMEDIIAYVKEGKPLPEKPIMITFDDGYYNNYLYAYPLLKEYGMKAVISPICIETDKYSELNENHETYSHLTWEMINEMIDSGVIEIQNHSYNLHKLDNGRKGVRKKKGESSESYTAAVLTDLKKAQKRFAEMTGSLPTTFTYPFGAYSSESQSIIEKVGFEASLGVEGRNFVVSRNEKCLIRIPRYNRSWKCSAESILTKAFPVAKTTN